MAVPADDDLSSVPAPGGDVRRAVKRIEPRSVLKFSLLFSVTVALVLLLAGVVLYLVASRAGIVDRLQTFVQNSGWPHFRVQPARVFEILVALTVAGAIGWVVISLLAIFVFNLVSEAVGGIEVTFRE
jgi:ABC-type Fe3+-siderophore transport system permease subunit